MVAFVTKAYSESDNCLDEIVLAETEKKPIIRLLFEKKSNLAEGIRLSLERKVYINCIDGFNTEKLNEVLEAIWLKIQ